MNPQTPEQLDATLGDLTEWSSDAPTVWRDALEQTPRRAAAWRMPPAIAAAIIVGLGVLIGVIAVAPERTGRVASMSDFPVSGSPKQGARPAPSVLPASPAETGAGAWQDRQFTLAEGDQTTYAFVEAGPPTLPLRQVIRTATIDLEVEVCKISC